MRKKALLTITIAILLAAVAAGGASAAVQPISMTTGSFAEPEGSDVVLAGNFNGGFTDVAILARASNEVLIRLGNSDGTFGPPTAYPVPADPYDMVLADLNGDGITDIVVSSYGGDAMSVLLGNGDGTFQPALTRSLAAGNFVNCPAPAGIDVGDLNGDGVPDLAFACPGNSTIDYVLYPMSWLSGGPLTFWLWSAPASSYAVKIADLDGDGRPEGIALSTTDNEIAVYHNLQEPQLGVRVDTYPIDHSGSDTFAGSPLGALAVADFNHDGSPDVVAAYTGGDDVFAGSADGTLTKAFSQQTANATDVTTDLGVADVNGDGVPDLALAISGNPGRVSIDLFTSDGSGLQGVTGNGIGIGAVVRMPLQQGGQATSVAPADLSLTGDGRPGFVIGTSSNLVGTLLNTTAATSWSAETNATATIGSALSVSAPSSVAFPLLAPGQTSDPLSVPVKVLSNDSLGYQLSISRTPFTAGDIPLSVLSGGVPDPNMLLDLTGLTGIPTTGTANVGHRTGTITSAAGDVWPLAFVLGPVPFTPSGTHTSIVTFTATGL